MQNRIATKTPTLSVFLMVVVTFTGLGIFLDGRVLPEQPRVETVIQLPEETPASIPATPLESNKVSISNEVAGHLKQAIEIESRRAMESSAALKQKLDKTKVLIGETQQLFEQKSTVRSRQPNEERMQAFNSKLEVLKTQLAEME